jgi:hypothetical protein
MLYTTSLIVSLGHVDSEEDIPKWRELYRSELSENLSTDTVSSRVLGRNTEFIIFLSKLVVIIFVAMEIHFIKFNAIHESALSGSHI